MSEDIPMLLKAELIPAKQGGPTGHRGAGGLLHPDAEQCAHLGWEAGLMPAGVQALPCALGVITSMSSR